MLPELTQEEFSSALDRVAAEVLVAAGAELPPVDAVDLAHALGLRVAFDERQPGRGRFVRLTLFTRGSPRGSILVRPEPRSERLQWAVAHEIGEEISLRVFDALGVDPREAPPQARETVANQMAGRLLLPGEWFGKSARRLKWDLLELKREFATASHELIARRMLDFEPPIIVTIFDHARRSFRRANVRCRLESLSVVERRSWRAAHETASPQFHQDGTQAVWAWPIHEDGWKREILRTAIELND